MDQITHGLSDLAGQIRSGQRTAVEVIQQALDAIDRHAALNAFVAVYREAALQQAAEADERMDSGQATGALHGVPVAIKDNFDEADQVCAAGCQAYLDRRPSADAVVVARLRAAGAIIIGRTNMHELADGVT